jgi:hypothetical protein
MTPWVLSDGTTVHQDGAITGRSNCAKALRGDIHSLNVGEYVSSGYGPMPSVAQLDLNVPHLVDSWVRKTADTYSLRVVSAPEVTYPVVEAELEPVLEPGVALVN